MESDEDRTERELVTQFLRHREIPCPVCGYILRGATSEQCPECGRYLSLQLVSHDHFVWPWMFMMVLTMAAMPFTAMGLLSAWSIRWFMAPWEQAVHLIMLALCSLVWPLIRFRRRIASAPKDRQTLMAAGLVLLWCVPLFITLLARWF